MSLLTVVLEQELHDEQERLSESHEMNHTEQLVSVSIQVLPVSKPWDSGQNIEDKLALEIVKRDLLNVIISIGPF